MGSDNIYKKLAEERIKKQGEAKEFRSNKGVGLDVGEFFVGANEYLHFNNQELGEEQKILLDYSINNKVWDLIVDYDRKTGSKTLHFFSEGKERYVLFNYDNFSHEIAHFLYQPKFVKEMYYLIEHYSITKKITKEMKEKIKQLRTAIAFQNGKTILYNDKTRELEITEERIPFNILIEHDLDEKKSALKTSLDKYFKGLCFNDEEYKEYFLNCLSTIFLPNKVVEKIYWVYGEGGIGKSELMKYITEIIGIEHSSSVPIKDFLDSGDRNYTRVSLESSIINIDDDFSKNTIKNTGFLKAFVSGKNKVNVDVKHAQPISFIGKAKIFILTNELPNFKNLDSGDRRRNIILPLCKLENTYNFDFLQNDKIKENLISNLYERAVKIANGEVDLSNKPKKVLNIETMLTDLKDDVLKVFELYGAKVSEGGTFYQEHISFSYFQTHIERYWRDIGKNTKDLNVKEVIGLFRKNDWVEGDVVLKTDKRISMYKLTNNFIDLLKEKDLWRF